MGREVGASAYLFLRPVQDSSLSTLPQQSAAVLARSTPPRRVAHLIHKLPLDSFDSLDLGKSNLPRLTSLRQTSRAWHWWRRWRGWGRPAIPSSTPSTASRPCHELRGSMPWQAIPSLFTASTNEEAMEHIAHMRALEGGGFAAGVYEDPASTATSRALPLYGLERGWRGEVTL